MRKYQKYLQIIERDLNPELSTLITADILSLIMQVGKMQPCILEADRVVTEK